MKICRATDSSSAEWQMSWLKDTVVSSEISFHRDSKLELYFSLSTHIMHKKSKHLNPPCTSCKKVEDKTIELWVLTFSSTVFLILALASLTVFPALLTAENRKFPMDFAPCKAFVDTAEKQCAIIL
jgi:hypothetical protein